MTVDQVKLIELMELMFFAYRDFVSDPDEILTRYGFGRAHHRVIHFIGRHPGIRVAELLNILRITKQSLGRVLKDLVDGGYVTQREGATDRRQRLLHLTGKGCALHLELMRPQLIRFRQALEETGTAPEGPHRDMLFNLIDASDRNHVRQLLAAALDRCGHSSVSGD